MNTARICSPSVGSKSFSNSFCRSSPSILRPSSLSSTSSNKPFILKPSNLNPINKPVTEGPSNNHSNCKENSSTNHKNGDVLKFVPLIETDRVSDNIVKPQTSVPSAFQGQSTFVFGQNLQERVVQDKVEEPRPSTSYFEANGTSDMLFSNAVKDTIKDTPNDTQSKKSLSESAREYEESRANKRKYEEVEVITGEEEETNVIQLTCKLFSYDKNVGNWQERGRGTLRLNDLEINENGETYRQSRLVFRTSGSLRVILNTKIWSEMMVEQASQKSIRLTAIDANGEIKVFLIMATPDESKQLFKYLEDRVKSEAERIKKKRVHDTDQTEKTTNTNQ